MEKFALIVAAQRSCAKGDNASYRYSIVLPGEHENAHVKRGAVTRQITMGYSGKLSSASDFRRYTGTLIYTLRYRKQHIQIVVCRGYAAQLLLCIAVDIEISNLYYVRRAARNMPAERTLMKKL